MNFRYTYKSTCLGEWLIRFQLFPTFTTLPSIYCSYVSIQKPSTKVANFALLLSTKYLNIYVHENGIISKK